MRKYAAFMLRPNLSHFMSATEANTRHWCSVTQARDHREMLLRLRDPSADLMQMVPTVWVGGDPFAPYSSQRSQANGLQEIMK